MSPEVTTEMVKEAMAQGACFNIRKSLISPMKLKNVWRHVYRHNKKLQDEKEKSIANCSETYQDQAVGSLITKDEAERFKRMRTTSEETQVKSSGTSEKEEDHSLISETSTERPQKKRRCVQWTPDLEKKLDEVVRELGEKARPRHVLKRIDEPDLTKKDITYRLKKYRSQKQQAPNVQPATSMNFHEGHHFHVLNSYEFSPNFNELFHGAYKHQPPKVPSIASPSSNDYSLNG